MIQFSNGTKAWFLNSRLHRVDGPALEDPDGTEEWFLDGKLHRVDGPAIEYLSGTQEWFLNGKRHRADGPAVERWDEAKEWWLNDRQFEQADYFALLKLRKFRSRIFTFNYVLEFNLIRMLKLSRRKAIIEWYYSPDNGGGKLAKKQLSRFLDENLNIPV